MMKELLYLRGDVQAEPLWDAWYAWPHLIPPANAARNLTERHFAIMDSYIGSPAVHANAVKNPKMLGGPFMDYPDNRVEEIKALRHQTKEQRTLLVELSAALSQLQQLITDRAKGCSLETLYAYVPDILRGRVELVYDLYNRATFRLIESLVYRSELYDRTAQSLMVSRTIGDDRPFVLSTPRLEREDTVQLTVPFDDADVDRLFTLAHSPRSRSDIFDLFRITGPKLDVVNSFLTMDPPSPYQPYTGRGARWRYFGHACILIEAGGVSILTDPVLSYTYESQISRYTYADLPHFIDYVLITHHHTDHMLLETLLRLRHRIGAIIVPRNSGGSLQDPSIELLLENVGFRNVTAVGEMQRVSFAKGFIQAIPFLGEHADLDIRAKLAYHVMVGEHRVLFAADSRNLEPRMYRHVQRDIGDIDAIFIGMECDGAPLSWVYGPLLLTKTLDRAMDHSRRLSGSDFTQAMDLVDCFRCKEVYVYAMGQEPWLNHIMCIKYSEQSRPIVESNKLIAECRRRGIMAERLFGEREILVNNGATAALQ